MTDAYEWTWQDTGDLLTYVFGYTNREPGHAEMLAWTDAAKAGRWEPELARRAVTQHYLEQPDVWIRPGHVHARVRAWREDALSRAAAQPQLEEPKRRRPVRALMARLTDAWAFPPEEPDEPASDELTALQVACPFEGCLAPAGDPCTTGVRGNRRKVPTHPSRHVALADAAGKAGLDPRIECDIECPVCAAPPNVRCVNLSTGGYLSFRLGTHYNRMVALNSGVQEAARARAGSPAEAVDVQAASQWDSRNGGDES